MLPLILLTGVCALTYSFEIVFGLAGTILMLPVLSVWFNTRTLVVYSVLPQILVGAIGLGRSPRTVALPFISRMVASAALGGLAGLALFYYLSDNAFRILLAGVVTAAGAYLVLAPGRLRLNAPAATALDLLAGASQALFGISGPIAMTRLLATFRDKLVVRNYALAFFLALNVLRAMAYALRGTFTPEIARMMAVSGPALALVLWFANRLHVKVDDAWFRRVVSWVVLAGGVSLFYR